MTSVALESLVPLTSDFSVDVENTEGPDDAEKTKGHDDAEKTKGPDDMKNKVLKAASEGDKTQLDGLLQYLKENGKKLSEDFRDDDGRTALMKALMNLKGGKNETIEVLLETAEKTGDLRDLINASYTAPNLKGFTALHVAIERRSLEYVKLLVEKGADVKAKAEGQFFQRKSEKGYYFGELPLSLAACTNQKKIVSFLIENENVNVAEKDSHGNTVLHALVATADNTLDNTKNNTDLVSKMYDQILTQNYKLKKNNNLESTKNKKRLNPLQYAAKLGKIELLKHILNRRIVDKETWRLSRKFTEWVCGPVQSSLYDVSSIDSNDENNSVLDIIVFKSAKQNRPEMLQIEPLHSLLQDKWDKFASRIFWIQFVFYVMYLIIFTTVAYYRKDGQPPFPVETTGDILHSVGAIICIIGAIRILHKSINLFWRRCPSIKVLLKRRSQNINGCFEGLFFLQASLLLLSVGMYFCGLQDYVQLLVLSVALAWANLLYYARGVKKLGIYIVMMQRMILGDLLSFLCIYSVLLLGFSAAIVTLRNSAIIPSKTTIHDNTIIHNNRTNSTKQKKVGYQKISFTLMEMFKFTIGMGNLDFTDDVGNKLVFHILLIGYILLTYILMLNMLIAVMSNTVQVTSDQSERIWKLQRAFTTLDVEKTVLKWMSCNNTKLVRAWFETKTDPKYFRVIEKNWEKWKSDINENMKEDFSGDISNENVKGVFEKKPTGQMLKNIGQWLKLDKSKDE